MIVRLWHPRAASIFSLIAAALLGGCSTFSSMDPFAGDSVDYAAGAPAAVQLSRTDHDALAYAFTQAMNSGKPQGWAGRRSRGVVEPEGYAIAGLKADPDTRLPSARGDFDLSHVVETEQGLYVLTRNSNIRTGPNAKAPVAEVLTSGSGVDVVGRVSDRNWMLIAADKIVRGYVFGDLLIKAPGSELELAGGPMRRPTACRDFNQRVTIAGARYDWTGAACNDGTGWRLAPNEPAAQDDALYGL